MSTKILNLPLGYCVQTIQCLIVSKDTKTDKQKFLALCKDCSDEITICFDRQLHDRIKIGCVYQISGFSKQLSTRYILTKYILYASFNLKVCDIQSPKVAIEYLNLPKEHNQVFISSTDMISSLASNVIVNIKAKLIDAKVRQDHFLLTIQIEDMSYMVRVKHLKNLSHLKKEMYISLKRVQTYKKNSYDSVLFCSTMFTQIFESETKPPEQINDDVTDAEVPIRDILSNGIINKRYKKKCKVLYAKFISFYNTCNKCSTKYANYNPMECDNGEDESEVFCGTCSFPIDKYCYVANLELTVVEASDVNVDSPFTILLFERTAEQVLKNTARNIRKNLDNYCAADLEEYLLGKITNNLYEFTIHLPYVNEKFDPVYKRFYAVNSKLIELSNTDSDNDTGIKLEDDAECETQQEEMHGLMLDGDSTATTVVAENINNHNEIPSDLCELVDESIQNTQLPLSTNIDTYVNETTIKLDSYYEEEQRSNQSCSDDDDHEQTSDSISDDADNDKINLSPQHHTDEEMVEVSPNASDGHTRKLKNTTTILNRKRRIYDDDDDIPSTSANTIKRFTKKK